MNGVGYLYQQATQQKVLRFALLMESTMDNNIIAILTAYGEVLVIAAAELADASDELTEAHRAHESASSARGDNYCAADVAATATVVEEAARKWSALTFAAQNLQDQFTNWVSALPSGVAEHGRVRIRHYYRWNSVSEVLVDGVLFYSTEEGFIPRSEGLRRKAAAKAANKAAQERYASAMAAAVAAVAAGIPLVHWYGQQGGTFSGPGGRVSASGLCRATGKSIEEIEQGEPRVRLPASRKARNSWRSQELPIEIAQW